jgi:hypothetical protein
MYLLRPRKSGCLKFDYYSSGIGELTFVVFGVTSRKASVLVLDECTASVDHETDALIQVRKAALFLYFGLVRTAALFVTAECSDFIERGLLLNSCAFIYPLFFSDGGICKLTSVLLLPLRRRRFARSWATAR